MTERCFEAITDDDLRFLGRLSVQDREALFYRNEHLGRMYSDRLFAVALCQGAALHKVNAINGVKDFDVWSFYCAHPDGPFPYRRKGQADFGDPRFGKTPGFEHFDGRLVDLLGRSYAFNPAQDVAVELRRYLRRAETATARFLAQKAVILIEPAARVGEVVWPLAG